MPNERRGLSLGESVLILVGLSGVIAGLVSGSVKTAIGVVAVLGFFWVGVHALSQLGVVRGLTRRLMRRCLDVWYRDRFLAYYCDIYPNEDPKANLVRTVGVVLLHPDHRSLEINQTDNPMYEWQDLRCTVRRRLRFNREVCQILHSPLRFGTVIALLPERLVTRSDGFPRIVPGTFVVRWKSSNIKKRCRKVVRSGDLTFRPHPLLGLLQRYRTWIDDLRSEARDPR